MCGFYIKLSTLLNLAQLHTYHIKLSTSLKDKRIKSCAPLKSTRQRAKTLVRITPLGLSTNAHQVTMKKGTANVSEEMPFRILCSVRGNFWMVCPTTSQERLKFTKGPQALEEGMLFGEGQRRQYQIGSSISVLS